jgi:prepilin-type N-terminal cleavage/methylation domain-containing protein
VKQRRCDKSCDGFTLIEVLVAMTIVGLGVVPLLQIFSLGLRLQARSAVRTEAVVQGARVMDELLARKRLGEGSDKGRLVNDGRWSSQVQRTRDELSSLSLSGNWDLKEVVLELFVLDGAQERRMELKTLRLSKKANP